jgi:ABC-type nitrate/sulfonate/bicarbonate transport system substrate-binding protein
MWVSNAIHSGRIDIAVMIIPETALNPVRSDEDRTRVQLLAVLSWDMPGAALIKWPLSVTSAAPIREEQGTVQHLLVAS